MVRFHSTAPVKYPVQPGFTRKALRNQGLSCFIDDPVKCSLDRRHAYHVLLAPSLIEPAFQ
jgi:hypothetical protein